MAVLPAPSVAVTVTVFTPSEPNIWLQEFAVPSSSSFVAVAAYSTFADQFSFPVATTFFVLDVSEASVIVSSIFVIEEVASLAVPANVYALPFVSAIPGIEVEGSTGTGAVLSTVTSFVTLPVFPAVSVAVIVNKCLPSLRSEAEYVCVQAPLALISAGVRVIVATPVCPAVVGVRVSVITI